MMKKLFIACMVTTSLLIISIIINLILASEWRGAVADTKTLNKENKSLEAKLEASKENNESLKEIGENFVNIMFTYDNKTAPEIKNKLLREAEGKAKAKLLEKPKTGEISDIEATKTAYSSKADIKESSFSRVNETNAIISVNFDQVFTISGSGSRTEYTMKVYLEKQADQWKVIDYETNQIF